MSAEETKQLAAAVDTINRNLVDYRKSADEQVKHIQEMGTRHGDLEEKTRQMSKDLADAIDTITEIKRQRMLAAGDADRTLMSDADREAKAAFNVYARKGQEEKALSTLSNPDGGFNVPTDMSGRIIAKVQLMSPLRQYANVQAISVNALEGPVDNQEADAGWVGEAQARPNTGTPKTAMYRIPVHERYAKPKATQTLLDDSVIDVEAWLSRKVADKFARQEAVAFITGDGVDKPRGILAPTLAATKDASRAWGTVEKVKTGAAGAFVAAPNGGDVFINTIAALHSKYWSGALFIMNRYTLAEVMKLKDGEGNYLWMPDFTQGSTGTLKGFRVDASFDHMPDVGAGAKAIAFGNFAEAYQIVDRQGIRVLRDPYSSKPFVEFYTTSRVGGDVLNSEAYKVITFEN
jgi:HK97 family phage major capsid protein